MFVKTSDEFKSKARLNPAEFEKLYKESIEQPEAFWAKQGENITWMKKWDKVKEVSFKSPVSIKWYLGGKLNISVNCIDRHIPHNGNKTAFFFEPDNPKYRTRVITYNEVYAHVNRLANVLKKHGVKKGDRVTIYMPMCPEATYSMLACARIGAVHSVIFGGFSPDAIVDRIQDCQSTFVITADDAHRGGRTIPLKGNIDTALKKCPEVNKVLVFKNTGQDVDWVEGRDFWYDAEVVTVPEYCEPEMMDSEDPLFILYTSGSTAKPKGVLHTTGGYLVFANLTFRTVFDYKPNDVFWCTADIGWVTGHSYVVYGPLSNCATSVIFEGTPQYPTVSRFWQVIDKYQVSIFYTAPTAIRALMASGDVPVKAFSRKSLRLLGTVGEPINPEAWNWYHRVVGDSRCPIVDTWWQTETGGILISPIPGVTELKPGSATKPIYGVQPVLLTPEGQKLPEVGATEGVLVLADSWPGQMRTVYRDHARFEQTYFSSYPGYYFTGDGCRRDNEGYYWITGRVDDVLNVAGHRLGTAEIESALVAHKSVAEAAVVGVPHDIKGQGIYAFVTLNSGVSPTEELRKELIQWVRQEISPIATPEFLQWAPGLPKTRSGKIMRRILRKIAEDQPDQLGDTSTLADPSVVQDLLNHRMNRHKA